MTSSPIDSYFKSRSTFYSLQYFCKDSQLLTACLAIFIICATFVAPEKLASCMLHMSHMERVQSGNSKSNQLPNN